MEQTHPAPDASFCPQGAQRQLAGSSPASLCLLIMQPQKRSGDAGAELSAPGIGRQKQGSPVGCPSKARNNGKGSLEGGGGTKCPTTGTAPCPRSRAGEGGHGPVRAGQSPAAGAQSRFQVQQMTLWWPGHGLARSFSTLRLPWQRPSLGKWLRGVLLPTGREPEICF